MRGFWTGSFASRDCTSRTWMWGMGTGRIVERGNSVSRGPEEVGARGTARKGKNPEKAREWRGGLVQSSRRLQPLPHAGCWVLS